MNALNPALTALLAAGCGAAAGFVFWSALPGLANAAALRGRDFAFAMVLQMALYAAAAFFRFPWTILNLAEAAVLALVAWRAQGVELRMALFLAVFYGIGAGAGLFALGMALAVLTSSPASLQDGTQQHAALVCSAFAFLAGSMTLMQLRLDRERQSAVLSRLAGLLAAAALMCLALVQGRSPVPEDEVRMWTLLAMAALMSVIVLNLRRQYDAQKELSELRALQSEVLERENGTMRRAYEANARVFHDFRRHMGVLRRLLENGETEKARVYLAELSEQTDAQAGHWTGDDAADWLIGSAAAACVKRGISFEAAVSFPRGAGIRSTDLCAVLGNLLDNAVEAAGASGAAEPFVHLQIQSRGPALTIRTQNTASAEHAQGKKERPPESMHGWGLRSARASAEKYGGEVLAKHEQDVFRAEATLFWEPVDVSSHSKTDRS